MRLMSSFASVGSLSMLGQPILGCLLALMHAYTGRSAAKAGQQGLINGHKAQADNRWLSPRHRFLVLHQAAAQAYTNACHFTKWRASSSFFA